MMLKITYRAAALFLGLALAPLCQGQASFLQPASFHISITVPQQSLDFSDLDARDEWNRPIKHNDFAHSFDAIVQSVLYKTLLENLTPSNKFIQNVLNLKHDVISGLLRQAIQPVAAIMWMAIVNGTKSDKYLPTFRIGTPAPSHIQKMVPIHNNFLFLISSLLSSTQILR